MTGKAMELVDIMMKKKRNVMCLQETKWADEKAKMLDNLDLKQRYSGKDKTRNRVGIIIDGTLKDDVVEVVRKGDRILALKLIVEKEAVNMICVYAPQVGLDDSIKAKFWEDLNEVIQRISHNEKIVIGGNASVLYTYVAA